MSTTENKVPSVEDLLKILEEEGKQASESIHFHDDILKFINFFNLESGKDKVPLTLLYELYKKWTNNSVSELTFKLRLSHYFGLSKGSIKNQLALNQSKLKLSSLAYDRLAKKKAEKIPIWETRRIKFFIDKNEIVRGTFYIRAFVLYRIFCNWNYDQKYKRIISYLIFTRVMSVFFEKITKWDGVYFGVTHRLKRTLFKKSRMSAILRHRKTYGKSKKDKQTQSNKARKSQHKL